MSGPNINQQRAIDATSKEDVIVSAGAGSGKTFTLSLKIYEMVKRGDVKPNELLVLTFTNNAAHEMKERIIRQFRENNSPFADEMVSSHIQTFDSFSLYLVSKYAGRLHLSDRINNMDESILDSKKREFLDEIFACHYKEDKERMKRVLVKYNLRDDLKTKNVVLDLYERLDSLLAKDRDDFIKNYEKKYLSRESYDSLRHQYAENLRDEIKVALELSNYYDGSDQKLKESIADGDDSDLYLKIRALDNLESFHVDYKNCTFSDPLIPQVYENLVEVLKSNDDDALFSFLKTAMDKYPDFFNGKKGSNKLSKKARTSLSPHLKPASILLLDKEEDYKRLQNQKEDVMLLLEMEEELREKINEYERRSNCFTFSSISTMALRLLQEEEFADVADEIREEFRFIMIDEYQDTNDLQEAFLSALMKERKSDKGRAHLFCVGDAKQSIYGFRNSNVALFNQRIEEYSTPSDEHYVIAMNTNYRSQKAVLDDINYIFDRYMTKDHGDIHYLDPLQQLVSGRGGEKDMVRKEGYGIKRLLYPAMRKESGRDKKKKECLAIIADIKKRMETETIQDKNGPRKMRYSDFCILVRTKGGYSIYQQLFKENGIPLNNIAKSDLKGIDPILLIQSLVTLLDSRMNHHDADIYHLFASIARSYIYRYDDDKIYRILTYKEEKDAKMVRSLKLIYEDEIMKTLDTFIKEHKEDSFDHIYLDLLTTFHIIDKLYLIGNVEDNVNKIESLHQMIINGENMQEGLYEFVLRFRNIDKYRGKLSSDTLIHQENAVDLMTIHASKGLEREIVYMPVSFNSKSSTPSMSKPDYDFSLEYGILLPDYYGFGKDENEEEDGPFMPSDYPYLTMPYFLFKNKDTDPERDEHVRLVYVALTRAKNSLVIVGNPPSSEKTAKNQENLYGMLSYVPHVRKFSENVMPYIKKYCSQTQIKRYETLVDAVMNFNMKYTASDFKRDNDFKYYCGVGDYLKEKLIEDLNDVIDCMLKAVYDELKSKYEYVNFTLDQLSRMYTFDDNIKTFDDFLKKMNRTSEVEIIENDVDEEEEEGEDSDADYEEEQEKLSESEWEEKLKEFSTFIKNEDQSLIPVSLNKKAKDEIAKIIAKAFLPYYLFLETSCSVMDEISYYKENEYPDLHEMISLNSLEKTKSENIVLDDPHTDMTRDGYNRMDHSDEDVVLVKKEHRRASMSMEDEEDEVSKALERGIRLHRYMELVSFTKRDTSFIKKEADRRKIDYILSLPIFDGVDESKVRKEYSYYDDELATYGSIDCLIIRENELTIVDYKTSNIDHEEYDRQLKIYQHNVSKIFHVDKSHIKMVLLSLKDGTTREVKD